MSHSVPSQFEMRPDSPHPEQSHSMTLPVGECVSTTPEHLKQAGRFDSAPRKVAATMTVPKKSAILRPGPLCGLIAPLSSRKWVASVMYIVTSGAVLGGKPLNTRVELVRAQALDRSSLRPHLKDVGRALHQWAASKSGADDIGGRVEPRVIMGEHQARVVFKASRIDRVLGEHQKRDPRPAGVTVDFFTGHLADGYARCWCPLKVDLWSIFNGQQQRGRPESPQGNPEGKFLEPRSMLARTNRRSES